MKKLSAILSFFLAIGVSGHATSEHRGYVRFAGSGMSGVVVIAAQGETRLRTITDSQGAYSFAGLTEGGWTIQIEPPGFAPIRRDVVIEPDAEPLVLELKILSVSEMKTESSPGFLPESSKSGFEGTPFLISGSVNNGDSRVFGNNRRRGPPLYTADLSLSANNSALDARPFSLTGQDMPKPAYNRSDVTITVDGPLPAPFLLRNGPRLTLTYSRTQNRNVNLQAARVPTASERFGDFSGNPNVVIDPEIRAPFPGNVIPPPRISPQAGWLLQFYPFPNFSSEAGYNYQVPIAGVTHRDNLQLQTGGLIAGQQLSGSFGFQRTRSDSPNLFAFVDNLRNGSVNGSLSWSRGFTEGFSATGSYTFMRTLAQTLPHFAYRENVSRSAGITGNAQDPRNWGPPNLNFSSGIAALSDGTYALHRTQSSVISYSGMWSRGNHTSTFGAGFRREQLNLLSELDARGTFVFTGAASGIDFADFLLGVPAASSIAFGSPDRYFRQSRVEAFAMDDWRVATSVTLNLGLRWDYEAPITERYGRIVNLDIAPGFEAVAPVSANERRGSLTGQVYPVSLLRPDRTGIQPRIGVAWRPASGSSLVIRAGYGIYRDTGLYRSIAAEMSQQSPFATRLSVDNSPSSALTLANGFVASPRNTPNTFAVDPGFRVGYAQNWQLSLQRDLPAELQITATYLGIKGVHLSGRILPNTFPSGGPAPCPLCPAGYVYLSSNGNSSQQAGTVQLRRRQRHGLAGSVDYTWSKAIDDSGLDGLHIAQDWRDRRAERALSNFDQRHRMTIQVLYTTAMPAGIRTPWYAWMGTLLREWTVMTEWRVSSGSPLTPIVIAPVPGTGVTGSLRPDTTGASLFADAPNRSFNVAAFSLPRPGKWGNAGRNTIPGPQQFFLDVSIGRTFRLDQAIDADLRVDVMNVLNRVTFAGWNTVVNSSQFGLPTAANSMRMVRPSLRVRF